MKTVEMKKSQIWAGVSALLLASTGAFAQSAPNTLPSPNCQIGVVVPASGTTGRMSGVAVGSARRLLSDRGSIVRRLVDNHWNVSRIEVSDVSEAGMNSAMVQAGRAGTSYGIVISRVDALGAEFGLRANIINLANGSVALEVNASSEYGEAMGSFVNRLPSCVPGTAELSSVPGSGPSSSSPIYSGPLAPISSDASTADYTALVATMRKSSLNIEYLYQQIQLNENCIDARAMGASIVGGLAERGELDTTVIYLNNEECRGIRARVDAVADRLARYAAGHYSPSRATVFHNGRGEVVRRYLNSVEYEAIERAVVVAGPPSMCVERAFEATIVASCTGAAIASSEDSSCEIAREHALLFANRQRGAADGCAELDSDVMRALQERLRRSRSH